jgi:hypothetical protein
MEIVKIINTVVPLFVSFTLGVLGTFWPEKIRSYVLRKIANKPPFLDPKGELVKAPGYLIWWRVSGIASLLGFLLLIYGLINGLR